MHVYLWAKPCYRLMFTLLKSYLGTEIFDSMRESFREVVPLAKGWMRKAKGKAIEDLEGLSIVPLVVDRERKSHKEYFQYRGKKVRVDLCIKPFNSTDIVVI